MTVLDPEKYWNAKARASAHDALGAVTFGEPARDRAIDRIQRRVIGKALAHVAGGRGRLDGAALDLGCGTGRWLAPIEALGLDYHGFDVAEAMIEIARREHPGARFEKFDGQRIPAADGGYALALSIGVLHHNDYGRQGALLGEIARVLRPGGALIMLEGIGPRMPSADGVFH